MTVTLTHTQVFVTLTKSTLVELLISVSDMLVIGPNIEFKKKMISCIVIFKK